MASEVETEGRFFRQVAERWAPSVVHIAGFTDQANDEACGEASGFFVDEAGLIVSVPDAFTDRASRRMCQIYRIRLSDGRLLGAEMYSVDSLLNLALLKVREPGSFVAIPIERRVGIQPGEPVVAVAGRPSSDAAAYSTGHVKAKHKKSVYGAGFGDMLINTQIQLPSQAFGGPLLNADGKLIGVNTRNVHVQRADSVDADESHALPVGMVQNFFKVAQAYPTSEQNWIGLDVRALLPDEKDSIYKTLGERAGLYIDFVWEEGPAGNSEIHAGDVLVKIDGTALKDTHQLNKLLLGAKPGDSAQLFVLRKRRGFISDVGIEKRPTWAGFVR